MAERVAAALHERGHEVFVLTTQPYNGLRSLFLSIRERTLESVYRFYPLNLYYLLHDRHIPLPIRALWHLIDLFHPSARHAIRHLIHDESPDVIITHNLKGIGISIGSEIQRRGVPHIHTLHDVQLSIPSGLLITGQEDRWIHRSLLRRWYEQGVRREIGTPDLVLSPSQFLVDFYRGRDMFTNTRIEVLPNPLPSDRTKARAERVASRTQFLYVGQLEPHKGINQLFNALDLLGDDVELHIAGEGGLANEVAARSARDARISFHGFVSFDHLARLLHSADAVIVPSVCYENSPTIIYESFLAGVPVIASRIGGVPELIEEEKTGLLVTPGDQEDLARAMQTIHRERDAWWARSEAIRRSAEKYSIKKYVDRLEALIAEIV